MDGSGLRGLCNIPRERSIVCKVGISTTGASKHEVPAVSASSREVVAGLVNQARSVCPLHFAVLLLLLSWNAKWGCNTNQLGLGQSAT